MKRKKKGKPLQTIITEEEPKLAVPVIDTYEEDGHTVKVGKTMWAEGARSGDPLIIRSNR